MVRQADKRVRSSIDGNKFKGFATPVTAIKYERTK